MSRAKDTLDRVFSRYIRLRDCWGGGGRCISCGAPVTFATCDAGHYIPRTHTATRWDVMNCHSQCVPCNRMRDGNRAGYRRGLIARYGLAAVERLEHKEHLTVKLTERDYRTLTEFFNQQLQQL